MREELIRDEDYSEEEAEIMLLKNKLDKANERIEILEDIIENAKEVITRDLQVNKRCLYEENLSSPLKILLDTWIKYDNKLLDLLKEEL